MTNEIVKRILITEKGSAMSVQNRYCLEVDKAASKPQIRQAVENAPDYRPGEPEIHMAEEFRDAVLLSRALAGVSLL